VEPSPYKAELHPEWKFVDEYPPPIGTKVLLLTRYGSAIIGHYYRGGELVAWTGLPKLRPDQKEKMNGYIQGTIPAP
jgi:hypothetical protein